MDAELKTYLDGKFGEVRTNFDAKVNEVRTEMVAGFSEVRTEMDAKFSEVRTEMDARFKEARAERRAEIEKTETNLLRAFHGWARSMEVRVRNSSTVVAGFDERLAYVEDRISELERRRAS